MLSQIFAVVQLILRLFGAWDAFMQYADDAREKERIARDQKRNAAVDEQKNAKSEADFDKAQDQISDSKP